MTSHFFFVVSLFKQYHTVVWHQLSSVLLEFEQAKAAFCAENSLFQVLKQELIEQAYPKFQLAGAQATSRNKIRLERV